MKLEIGRKQYLDFGATTAIGANPWTWFAILSRHWRDIDWQFWPKAVAVSIVTCLMWPVIMWERLLYDRKIKVTEVKAPLFILGHQRSGTTYLNYLIGRDPQFAHLTVKESFMPWVYLTSQSILKRIYRKALPDTRPMDNLRMGLDLPTEPEYSLGNMTVETMIPGYYFPKRMSEVFRRAVLFESNEAKTQWQRTLHYFLQKLTLRNNGMQLVIKSPENTARIKEILEIFPDARFIHISRDPYSVYFSTERLYSITLPMVTMQHCEARHVEDYIVFSYKEMMTKYLNERALIPAGHLAEIRYEDLIGNETEVLRKAYNDCGLAGFEQAKPHIESEVRSYSDYKTNKYDYPEQRKREVFAAWKEVFDALGYKG
jgi:omega-hydroxy-beta-dihydromenaquinone-9 sulfotransferase